MEIDLEKFVTVCEDLNVSPHAEYSGRFMYGRQCVAIYGSTSDLMQFVLKAIPQIDPNYDVDSTLHMNAKSPEIVVEHSPEWLAMRQDTMGSDMVYYWPDIQAVENTEK